MYSVYERIYASGGGIKAASVSQVGIRKRMNGLEGFMNLKDIETPGMEEMRKMAESIREKMTDAR